jgi:integrase/recombinase XerD
MDTQNLTSSEKYRLEQALKELKPKKTLSRPECIQPAEVEKLIRECRDKTISLMIEFLYSTGLRISEALGILLTDVKLRRNGQEYFEITIKNAKRGKERRVFVDRELMTRIRDHFSGQTYLFEHTGKTYNRTATTNRIKLAALEVLGKPISAHTLRHSAATHLLHKTKNLKGVSRYLGHSSTSLTADLYVHSDLKPTEVLGNHVGNAHGPVGGGDEERSMSNH